MKLHRLMVWWQTLALTFLSAAMFGPIVGYWVIPVALIGAVGALLVWAPRPEWPGIEDHEAAMKELRRAERREA